MAIFQSEPILYNFITYVHIRAKLYKGRDSKMISVQKNKRNRVCVYNWELYVNQNRFFPKSIEIILRTNLNNVPILIISHYICDLCFDYEDIWNDVKIRGPSTNS